MNHDPDPDLDPNDVGLWPLVHAVAVSLGIAAVALLLALIAISGCNTPTRYVAARSTWAAVEVADTLAAEQYRAICPTAGAPYTAEQMAECRVRLQRLEHLVPLDDGHTRYLSLSRLVRVVRDAAGAAVLGLWAAEEGEAPGDLRQRLSCVASALAALAGAFRELELDLPVIVEQALGALAGSGSTRVGLLGTCPGVDPAGGGT